MSGGSMVSPDSAMQVSAFHSGVLYVATQIAKLPWQIKDKDNKEIDNYIAKLIGSKPNSEMTSFRWRLFMVTQAIVEGNAYSEIERDSVGRPVALWPIPSSHVQPERTEAGKLYYRIVGGGTNHKDTYLLPEDVFHIPNFFTKDGIVGQGVVSYASEILGIALGSDKFANSLYANGAMPSGTLEMDGSLSEEALERLKESWKASHGSRKVGGTAILEEGIKYKPITYSPDVLQFLETRKFTVQEIARFLRVPPTKLFDSEASTYNNIEHANLEVVVDTLDAWARNFEAECDSKLLSDNYGGRRSEMDLYAIFRGDMETRAKYFNIMMQNAAITPNEIRKKEGAPSYEGGDRFYIATNNFDPVDRMDEIIDSNIKSKDESIKKDNSEVDEAIVNYLKKRAK